MVVYLQLPVVLIVVVAAVGVFFVSCTVIYQVYDSDVTGSSIPVQIGVHVVTQLPSQPF